MKSNTLLNFPIRVDGRWLATQLTLDANWRWIHFKDQTTNCFGSGWSCKTQEACSQCELEGVAPEDWLKPYGVQVSGSSVRLDYVTVGPYSTNVGSRLYVVDPSGSAYQGFDLRNKEISFTVDVSQLPCGLNGAFYFVEMPLKNPYNPKLSSAYGVNYGDAQCPKDIKYLEGFANLGTRGACSNEIDVWEANRAATSLALHPCRVPQVTPCANTTACGVGSNRYKGVCDMDGADYNAQRHNQRTLYGVGQTYTIDTSQPIQVTVEFHGSPELTKVVRRLKQGTKEVLEVLLTTEEVRSWKQKFGEVNMFEKLGGLKTLSDAFQRRMVLVLSLWDDSSTQMRWLDSVYPKGSSQEGSYRGPCSEADTSASTLRRLYPQSRVVYSDISIQDIGSTPSTPQPPPPTPSPTKQVCQTQYGQCGGKQWSGSTCCVEGFTCQRSSDWYSQCLPSSVKPSTPAPTQNSKQWVCQQCVYQ